MSVMRYTDDMTQLAIQIPDDLKPFIDQSVATGSFSDAGDFLTNLLYHFKAQSESELSAIQDAKLVALRSEIAIGVAQAERGELVDFTAEEIISDWNARPALVN